MKLIERIKVAQVKWPPPVHEFTKGGSFHVDMGEPITAQHSVPYLLDTADVEQSIKNAMADEIAKAIDKSFIEGTKGATTTVSYNSTMLPNAESSAALIKKMMAAPSLLTGLPSPKPPKCVNTLMDFPEPASKGQIKGVWKAELVSAHHDAYSNSSVVTLRVLSGADKGKLFSLVVGDTLSVNCMMTLDF